MTGKRLLLVSPEFHGYWRSIESAFTALGHDVVTHLYDAAPRAEKLWNKVRHELPSRLRGTRQHLSPAVVTARAIEVLHQTRPDIVLVVRGDALTADFWGAARDVGAVPAMWLYDEIARMDYEIETIGDLAAIATYSALDAATLQRRGVPAVHVPLAYDPAVRPTHHRFSGEFTFIGARFGKREDIMTALAAAGLPARAFGRDWSTHPLDRLRTFRTSGSPVPAGRDLALADAYGVMAASLGTLNVHGAQDGFTMRTFEAAGVGAVQLIDRADVGDLYEPGREVLVFSDTEDLLRLCRDVLASPTRMADLRAAAQQRTADEHTFVHRARVLQTLWH